MLLVVNPTIIVGALGWNDVSEAEIIACSLFDMRVLSIMQADQEVNITVVQ